MGDKANPGDNQDVLMVLLRDQFIDALDILSRRYKCSKLDQHPCGRFWQVSLNMSSS